MFMLCKVAEIDFLLKCIKLILLYHGNKDWS
jgi:hypothetical protein